MGPEELVVVGVLASMELALVVASMVAVVVAVSTELGYTQVLAVV
jgi:hypothetical protein